MKRGLHGQNCPCWSGISLRLFLLPGCELRKRLSLFSSGIMFTIEVIVHSKMLFTLIFLLLQDTEEDILKNVW